MTTCGHRSKGVGFVCVLPLGHSGDFHEAAKMWGGGDNRGPRWPNAGESRESLKDKTSHG